MPRMLTFGSWSKPAADKHRVGKRGVVVSGKDHDRHAGLGEQPSCASENVRAELIVLKGVAGQQQDVGSERLGSRQHRTQGCRAIAALGQSAILVDVQIRAVDRSPATYSARLDARAIRVVREAGHYFA